MMYGRNSQVKLNRGNTNDLFPNSRVVTNNKLSNNRDGEDSTSGAGEKLKWKSLKHQRAVFAIHWHESAMGVHAVK